MKLMQQERAKFALEHVEKARNNPDTHQKEYLSYAANLPAMIHTNGLGQAAAFFKSKGGTHEQLYQLLSEWLTNDDQPLSDYNDLLEGIVDSDMQTYRLAQAESQALMDWVKKFAKAFMDKEAT